MSTLNGTELQHQDVLVVGGTGNVGTYLVDGFLRAGARVLVPSRSQANLERLTQRLTATGRTVSVDGSGTSAGSSSSGALVGIVGDIGSPTGAALVQERVRGLTGGLTAVAAAPAGWHQTPSMLQAGFADFRSVVENSLYPHYLAAETFLPLLTADGTGSYTAINGPVGSIKPVHPGIGSMAVVSVAQTKLLEAIADETGGTPRVNEVVMRAFLGPQGTRPGSPLSGEQVGDFIAALASAAGRQIHNQSILLDDPKQVEAALAGRFAS